MVKKSWSVVEKLMCPTDRSVPMADDADDRMMVGRIC